jgi:hypothetical protein
MFDQYTLLANQLRDIHNTLKGKIVDHPKFAPKWAVETYAVNGNEEAFVVEITPLLSLAETLERMAAHHAALDLPSETGMSYVSGIEQPK